jgi:hypothetical protein
MHDFAVDGEADTGRERDAFAARESFKGRPAAPAAYPLFHPPVNLGGGRAGLHERSDFSKNFYQDLARSANALNFVRAL